MTKQKLSATEIAKKSAKIKTKMAMLQDEYNLLNGVKVTKFRFGNFNVKLSDQKVDISPVPTVENQGQILSSHTYRLGSDVFMAFYMNLSKYKLNTETESMSIEKTEDEIRDGERIVAYFITAMYRLPMFLSDNQFANEYIKIVTEAVDRQEPAEITKEQDDEILSELKEVEEAKEIVSGDIK